MLDFKLFLILALGFASTNANKHAEPTDVRSSLLRSLIPHSYGIKSRAACPENFSPCTCESTSNGLEVVCQDVLVDDIREVFYRTRALSFYSVSLTSSDTGSVDLPYDLLSNKVTQRLIIQCPPAVSPPLALTIDTTTFEYTRRTTTFFEIEDCDLNNQTDLAFLNGFEVLETLRFERTLNITSFASLPALDMRALKELAIIDSTGLGDIEFPILTPAKLERLYLDGNGLLDANINSILVSVGSSSSVNSLQELTLTSNLLQKVPRIGGFSQLNTLDVSNNVINFLSLSTLIFSAPVKSVNLNDTTLRAIEEDAFQGNFAKAQVSLENNELTEFRKGVFISMLTEMSTQPPEVAGKVIVTGNPFECGCGLAWLIRDNPTLIPSVKNGVCGGFFKFEDLNPLSFTDCP